jgi:putative transposase
MTPAASFRTRSSIPTRGWIRFSIACAKPSPPAVFPRASTWTTPRSIARRGRPLGPARIAASIGILIIHTPPYQPEGRGKIERFFRSVREQFLASLNPQALLSLEPLNERLWHWLDTVYHRHEHSALHTTPLLRWQRDIEQVRQLPPATDMRRLFFHRVDRLVRRDSTFLLRNRFFEAPPQLAGKRIEVRFDPLDPAHVEIYCDGKPEGAARLVDAVVNGRTYR